MHTTVYFEITFIFSLWELVYLHQDILSTAYMLA